MKWIYQSNGGLDLLRLKSSNLEEALAFGISYQIQYANTESSRHIFIMVDQTVSTSFLELHHCPIFVSQASL